MGWGSALKKIGGAALGGATGGIGTALVEGHGDQISEAFEEIGDALEGLDELRGQVGEVVDKVNNQLVTRDQADRIEAMIEELLARTPQRRRKSIKKSKKTKPMRNAIR